MKPWRMSLIFPLAISRDNPLTPTQNDKDLALAVINRAIEDATQRVSRHKRRTATQMRLLHEISEAKLFLTAKDGDWHKSRQAWLTVAELDSSAFDRRMKEMGIE